MSATKTIQRLRDRIAELEGSPTKPRKMPARSPKIEKGIPIPSEHRAVGGMKGFVAKLKPGDSFVNYYARRATLNNYAYANGFKLFARKLDEEEVPEGEDGDARFWRVEQDAPRVRRVK